MEDSHEEFKKCLSGMADEDLTELFKTTEFNFHSGSYAYKEFVSHFKRLALALGYSYRPERPIKDQILFNASKEDLCFKSIRDFRRFLILVEAQARRLMYDGPDFFPPQRCLFWIPSILKDDVKAVRASGVSYKVLGLWELIERDFSFTKNCPALKKCLVDGKHDLYRNYVYVSTYLQRLRHYLMTVEAEAIARKRQKA